MAKPIAVLITDTHLTKDNTAQVENIFEQCYDLAEEIEVKKIFHLGDFFTNRVGQTLLSLKTAKNIFKKATERKLSINLIAGNHDKTDQSIDDSYIDIFEKEGINIYTDYTVHMFDKIVVYMLSFYTEHKYIELLNVIIEDSKKNFSDKKVILLTHIAIDKVINNDGSRVENDVQIGLFDNFDNVYVGHYHNRQQISDNIHYIGSSHPQNFGEDNEKGFCILYDDGEIEYVNSVFPKYLKFYLDCNDKPTIDEHFKKYKNSEDNVRFIFRGNTHDFASIDEKKYKENKIDVKFEDIEQITHVEAIENGEYIEFDKKQILRSWMEYCKINAIPADKKTKGMKLIANNVVSE